MKNQFEKERERTEKCFPCLNNWKLEKNKGNDCCNILFGLLYLLFGRKWLITNIEKLVLPSINKLTSQQLRVK